MGNESTAALSFPSDRLCAVSSGTSSLRTAKFAKDSREKKHNQTVIGSRFMATGILAGKGHILARC